MRPSPVALHPTSRSHWMHSLDLCQRESNETGHCRSHNKRPSYWCQQEQLRFCTFFYVQESHQSRGYDPFSSVQFSHSVVFDSLQPHRLQHARLPCSSRTPGAYSNSCPLSRWCHPTISSSVVPFSSCLQSFPASGAFQVNLFFTSSGQRIGVSASASVPPTNIQDWLPLGWTGWISLQSKGLSRDFSNTTVQKYQFFGVQLSL